MWKKNCPNCGRDQAYNSERAYQNAIKSNSTCKKCSTLRNAKRKGDCSKLLEDNLLAYYWIGFIMADGHIHKNKRLKVCLAIKDKEHILKLKDYLSIESIREDTDKIEFSVMDSYSLGNLCSKFSIRQNKTKKACNISNIKEDLLKALFIGFVDGDGSIRKQHKRESCCLYIKCHSAWLENLNIFSQELLGREQAYLNNKGYANLNIGTKKVLQELKQFSITNNLPIMNRKWKLINME